MTKLVDIPFEGAQAGVTLVTGGTGVGNLASPGRAGASGDSYAHLVTLVNVGNTAYARLDLSAISGSSDGATRGVGFTFKATSYAADAGGLSIVAFRTAAGGAVANVLLNASGNWVLKIGTTMGAQGYSGPASGEVYDMYAAMTVDGVNATLVLFVNGAQVLGLTVANATTAIGEIYLGSYYGTSTLTSDIFFDAAYISDALYYDRTQVSNEALFIHPVTSPVSSAARMVQLEGPATDVVWSVDDTSIARVTDDGLLMAWAPEGGTVEVTATDVASELTVSQSITFEAFAATPRIVKLPHTLRGVSLV